MMHCSGLDFSTKVSSGEFIAESIDLIGMTEVTFLPSGGKSGLV